MYSFKIYLCGITQNAEKDVDDLTKDVWQYFDGLIWVDGGSKDRTVEILESRKKEGAVIYRKWTNDHDFQMNEFLRAGIMHDGDWFVLRDSPERISASVASSIRQYRDKFLQANIRTLYKGGKVCFAQFSEDLLFLGTPHWGMHNVVPNGAELETVDPNFGEGFYSTKKRTDKEWLDHYLKYYYVYGRSNHMQLCYPDQKSFYRQEILRREFRNFCRHELKLNFTLESLLWFLSTQQNHYDFFVKQVINNERIMNMAYRHYVLGEGFDKIYAGITERENWANLNINMVRI